jgi:hypothetical protein
MATYQLTDREQVVTRHVLQGMSTREIAEHLFISARSCLPPRTPRARATPVEVLGLDLMADNPGGGTANSLRDEATGRRLVVVGGQIDDDALAVTGSKIECLIGQPQLP